MAKKFQSMHQHGVRLRDRYISTLSDVFQSTHPHGVRRAVLLSVSSLELCFNPRTHMGCDIEAIEPDWVEHVSIHAPTWGATEY